MTTLAEGARMRAALALALTSAIVLGGVTVGAVGLVERNRAIEAADAALASARAEALAAHLAAVRARTELASVSTRSAQLASALVPLHAAGPGWVEGKYLTAVERSLSSVRLATPVDPPPVPHVDESIDDPGALAVWTSRFRAMDRLATDASVSLSRAVAGLETNIRQLAEAASRSGAATIAGAPMASEAYRTGSRAALDALSQAIEDDADLVPVLTDFATSAVALVADNDAAAARAAAEAATATGGGGAGGSSGSGEDSWLKDLQNAVSGPQPTIIVNENYVPGCAGYAGWTWYQNVWLPGGTTYTLDYTVPFDYALFDADNFWLLSPKACV